MKYKINRGTKKEKIIYLCNTCKKKYENINNFFTVRDIKHTDFSGIKHIGGGAKEHYCSEKCLKIREKMVKDSIPYLAAIDMSMNYNNFFHREKGNEGYYIREDFKEKVNGLWDYKNTPQEFKDKFKKYFGHLQIFELHDRYKNDVDKMFWKESF